MLGWNYLIKKSLGTCRYHKTSFGQLNGFDTLLIIASLFHLVFAYPQKGEGNKAMYVHLIL